MSFSKQELSHISVSCQAQKATDKTDGKTSKESTPRHHYERTTGTTGGITRTKKQQKP